MKLRELIIVEDEGSSVATTSSDIATVAYPLFVRGKSNKAKRKNARAAVGQRYVPGPKGIGTGVFEGKQQVERDGILLDVAIDDQNIDIRAMANGKQLGYVVFDRDANTLVADDLAVEDRFKGQGIAKIMYDYVKELGFTVQRSYDQTPAGKQFWDKNQGNDGQIWEQEVEEGEWSQKYKSSINCANPKGFSQRAHCASKKKNEAHVVGNDSVIYRLDRENPMSDTEVAVIGGAGRYSLKALRDKARREAAALAQDLSIEHGGAFRRSAENIKQLTNTINTIVAAYNELARLRRKGGRGSRGITDEDANFIRECIRVVEQATQNYRLLEGVAVEPDPQGYPKDKLTNPKYTVVVNTPGDLDWYKIGMYWHDKVVDPHEFGQDDSDTVMVAQGPEEYKEMLAKIKQMGLTYKTIGGTDAQPEIHSNTY